MPMTPKSQIHQIIETWTTAVRAKDVDGVMSLYSEDVIFFDVAPPLILRGTSEFRRGLEEWFGSFDGLIGYHVEAPAITVGDGVAFSTSLVHLTGQRTSGPHDEVTASGVHTDVWMRATWAFRKRDQRWQIVHEHVSIPIYMDGSGRAAVDLRP